MSPYCIRVCVQQGCLAVQVTILHYSVCASKAVCSTCHHTALQCVHQQGCLQFMSPYCITVCVLASVSAVHFITLHYSVTDNKAVCSSCHHISLHCVCQQGYLQFMSTYYITVCVTARLSAVMSTYYITVCVTARPICSSCQHIALQCVCQQGSLQFMSPHCTTVCVPARLSAVHVNILHYSICASKAISSSCQHI